MSNIQASIQAFTRIVAISTKNFSFKNSCKAAVSIAFQALLKSGQRMITRLVTRKTVESHSNHSPEKSFYTNDSALFKWQSIIKPD